MPATRLSYKKKSDARNVKDDVNETKAPKQVKEKPFEEKSSKGTSDEKNVHEEMHGRHMEARKAMHKRHETESRDMHGNHRDERRKMQERHMAEMQEMNGQQMNEMANPGPAPGETPPPAPSAPPPAAG